MYLRVVFTRRASDRSGQKFR